jgi:hypothetical protein
MEELLKQIAKNTKPKESFQIILSGNTTRFTTNFDSPLVLEGKYEVALVNLETWYSFPNLDSSNNVLSYSNDAGTTWHEVRIPEGSYELKDLNEEIIQQMRMKKHYNELTNKPYISITANVNTLRTELEITDNYKVDFRVQNSFNKILGFKNKVYHAGINTSESIVDILPVNSIFIALDLINGSYVNGSKKNIIYSFFPNVEPGYKIVETPPNLVYLPVNKNEISSIEVAMTDQDGKLLNLRGEKLTIRLHIREL